MTSLAFTPNSNKPTTIVNNVESGKSFEPWTAKPPSTPSEAKLTMVQITDVYTLENFASLKTMLEDTRRKSGDSKVVSLLTGDFLAPYLLSSVDGGKGMMNAITKTPIDYLTWGNHEADIAHKTVCKHVKTFHDKGGVFINSNMQSHEAMQYQKPFEVIEITSPDGTQTRKIGLIAVLSDDPALYKHFKAPGAFGGARIECPWETLKKYKELLEGPEYKCDLVIPLQHLYVPDDHKTCANFDFPVIMSGHDHHVVDETVDGTRLLKPGQDAERATVLEICWDTAKSKEPEISARFVETKDWEADEAFDSENSHAYDALLPLRKTELARVPLMFEPLSSSDARGKVTTMGKFICSLLRSSLNVQRSRQEQYFIDAVLLMGGNIRGSSDYEPGGFFSMEALEAEIKSNEVIGVVEMPGWVLAQAISETHAGDPIPGWLQYDNDIVEEYPDVDGPSVVTEVAGQPIEPDRMYRVATKISDLTNGQSPTLTKFYKEHAELIPPKGNYVNIHSELMSYFARNLWRRIWEAVEPPMLFSSASDSDESEFCYERFEQLDYDGDGLIGVNDIQRALKDIMGFSVHAEELSLAEAVHSTADVNNDGEVTLEDFELFADELPSIYSSDRWRLRYARQQKLRHQMSSSPVSVTFTRKRAPIAFTAKP